VPLLVGDADATEVAAVLERLWGGPETLIVISSDLSHYLDYDSARASTRAPRRPSAPSMPRPSRPPRPAAGIPSPGC
jgi:hypothetical protein